jgi:hypothetical protein
MRLLLRASDAATPRGHEPCSTGANCKEGLKEAIARSHRSHPASHRKNTINRQVT